MAERLAAPGSAARAARREGTAAASEAVFGARVLAYLLDCVVLFGFIMLFATAAFLAIFIGTDYGEGDLNDATAWTGVAILLATLPAWLGLNLLLAWARGQTVGQYVLGLRAVTADGALPSGWRLLGYWLALHPLLYNPLFALLWLLFAYSALGLSENVFAVVAGLAMATLCLLAPLGGLIFALGDGQRRAIHDRLASMMVVRVG